MSRGDGDGESSNGDVSFGNLSGPGGSGLIRLKPSHAKLPSVKTTGKLSKKSFSPSIPTGHRVKKEHNEADAKPIIKAKKPFAKEKVRKKEKKDVIKSESVFSMGPAQKSSQGRELKGPSSVTGNGGLKMSVTKASTMVVKSAMDECDDKELSQSEPILDTFKESALPPLQLPLNCSASHLKQKSLPELLDVADHISNQNYLFLQLPDCLPISGTSNEGHSETSSEQNKVNDLSCISEGHVGKLQIHKSGRVSLVLGEVSLDVSMGTPCGFLQELVCIRTSPPDLKMMSIGHSSHRVVCTPNFDSILEPS